MADTALVETWLRQARADVKAADMVNRGMAECHRRYFLQQAYEKGIKALGLLLWNPSRPDTRFNSHFLNRHDPLRRLEEQQDLPRSLKMLLRQVGTELDGIDNSGLLRKVDGTSPSTNSTDVSYRYPFVDLKTAALVAPVDWCTDDWDTYQGNETGVVSAVTRLLNLVEKRLREDRAPR